MRPNFLARLTVSVGDLKNLQAQVLVVAKKCRLEIQNGGPQFRRCRGVVSYDPDPTDCFIHMTAEAFELNSGFFTNLRTG